MCLHIKSGPYVARKDKVVYKVFSLMMKNQGLYYRKQYRANQTVIKVELGIDDDDYNLIHEGYHAYTNKCNTLRRFDTQYFKIVSVIIPAGSRYYLGHDGDIVSDRIRTGSLVGIRA